MKKLLLSICAVLTIGVSSCSDQDAYDTPKEAKEKETVEMNIDQMIQDYLVEAKPYISPELQEFIGNCNNTEIEIPLEDFLASFILSETEVSRASTEVLQTRFLTPITQKGYSNFSAVDLNGITISLNSWSNSALRQSLSFGDECLLVGNGPYKVRLHMYTAVLALPTQNAIVMPFSYNDDWIGIDPTNFTLSSLSNSTTLTRGFKYEYVLNGYAVQFTTYAFTFGPTGDNALMGIILPRIGNNYISYDSYSTWGKNIEWTYYVM